MVYIGDIQNEARGKHNISPLIIGQLTHKSFSLLNSIAHYKKKGNIYSKLMIRLAKICIKELF